MKKIILNMGDGTIAEGCHLFGEILSEGILLGEDCPATAGNPPQRRYPVRFAGKLPGMPELAATHQKWESLYRIHNRDYSLRIQLLQREGLRYSETAFKRVCAELVEQLNCWLDAPEFRSIDRTLRSELAKDDRAQIILETSDSLLCKLPWHRWRLLEDYPRVEVAMSAYRWHPLPVREPAAPHARILATFGNAEELNLDADLEALKTLPDAELSVLEAPTLSQLHESLWQPQGWDVFFFAGHSQTCGDTGVIDLNSKERLTIDQIKYALERVVENGLKIAIFNSCDGLGLAQQLFALQVPYVVVMREPIPDHVAQKFLEYLLAAFVAGAPFHLAVGEARRRLAGFEGDLPSVSWLPIVWQNPTASALYWKTLQRSESQRVSDHYGWLAPLGKSLLVGGLVLTMRAIGLLEALELAAYDRLMQQRPAEPIDSRIVAVEISEEDTSRYGYPLPDEALVAILDRVNQSDPLAVGLNMHRAKPTPAQRSTLTQARSKSGLASAQLAYGAQAETLSVMSDYQPANGIFASAEETGYDRFLQQVENTSNLFLVCAYSSRDKNYQSPQQLAERLRIDQVGFSDLLIDTPIPAFNRKRGDLSPTGTLGLADASVRRQLLSYDPNFSTTPSSCITPYSFSFQLAFQYLSAKGVAPLSVTQEQHWQFGSQVFLSLPQRFGGYQQLETPSSQILLNYRTSQPAKKVSLEQLFSGDFDPQIFKDRIVMIGYNAPVSKDYFETPYGSMSGLWVHVHMVSQLLSAVLDDRPLIHALPQWREWQWADMLWIVCWGCISGYVSWSVRRSPLWLLVMVGEVLLLYAICWLAMVYGLWLPLVPSVISAVGAATVSKLRWSTLRLAMLSEAGRSAQLQPFGDRHSEKPSDTTD